MQAPALGEVPPPAGLVATLRPYQREGLSWLQYLRQQGLGACWPMTWAWANRADAGACAGREGSRSPGPSDAGGAHFAAAQLAERSGTLHPGPARADPARPARETLFEAIPGHDLVLTTYPLLWRDEQALQAHTYHLLILDEAQQVKNPKSRAAITLRTLQARHRLCLTGTPLENHLGELWTQFDFLLPAC